MCFLDASIAVSRQSTSRFLREGLLLVARFLQIDPVPLHQADYPPSYDREEPRHLEIGGYARLSPESANIFDNLHMLHGIAYDILAYEGWSIDQKRKEMIRVVQAMSYQPGDERYVRQFDLPYPEMDPRRYEEWMTGYAGSMNRIMEEMLAEMWPMMSPDGSRPVGTGDPPSREERRDQHGISHLRIRTRMT